MDHLPALARPDGRARQWEDVMGSPASFRRDVALNRALRRADFAAVRHALAEGVSAGVPASPMALQVAQMLGRLGVVGEVLSR
jgi:hypothetical protein